MDLKSPPDLDEVSQALKSIIKEGQRTSDILDAIRAVFKKDDQEIAPVDINHVVGDVFDLVQSEVQQQGVLV